LYCTYEDIGAFLFVVAVVNALVRLAVRVHFLRSSDLIVSRLGVQAPIMVALSFALYAILKFRHHRPVIGPLGWLVPTKFYSAVSILAGMTAALVIACFTHLQGRAMPPIPAKAFFVLGFLLGPVLEESVFRGCLLPVLARGLGTVFAVLATAVLFGAFHAPGDITHWLWFTATGVAYGLLRVFSGTTTAPALMHAVYNFTLFLAARFYS
jgi:membrane protease YdiL (CAAX protease family)